jgi:putative ABC transport system permease protein
MVSRTVVGVVGDVHQTPDDVDLLDVYIPFAQGTSRFASVYFRTNGSSQQWLETIRTVVASIDNEVFVGSAPILSDQVDGLLAGPRFITAVLSVFAAFSALLALMGIYGVTAYVVQQRAREIAIRMAIGASAATVTLMFFRNSSKILMIGIFCGLTAGAAGARILQSQLHGVDRLDPWTFIATGLFLATTGLLATWLPAWRLVHDDPTRALRAE